MTEKPKAIRGFAAMSPEKRRAIAAKGGRAVPNEKRGFSVDRQLASTAGKKGGLAVPSENRTFSKSKELAKSAGRKGGLSR